jgi:hypothetical protein
LVKVAVVPCPWIVLTIVVGTCVTIRLVVVVVMVSSLPLIVVTRVTGQTLVIVDLTTSVAVIVLPGWVTVCSTVFLTTVSMRLVVV